VVAALVRDAVIFINVPGFGTWGDVSGLQLPRVQFILGAADIPTPLAASFCHGVGHCNVGSYRERFLDER
jgi:hypothetical protein